MSAELVAGNTLRLQHCLIKIVNQSIWTNLLEKVIPYFPRYRSTPKLLRFIGFSIATASVWQINQTIEVFRLRVERIVENGTAIVQWFRPTQGGLEQGKTLNNCLSQTNHLGSLGGTSLLVIDSSFTKHLKRYLNSNTPLVETLS